MGVTQAELDAVVADHVRVLTKVSQKAFDEVVQENITEFEMTPEEAAEDAVSQFEAQGADLSQIVKDPGMKAEKHKVELMVDNVTKLMGDVTLLTDAMSNLKAELTSESERALAGTNGGVDSCVAILDMHGTNASVSHDAMGLLVTLLLVPSNRDFLRVKGVEAVVAAINAHAQDADVVTMAFKLIRNACVKHETNRGMFMERGMGGFVVTAIRDLHTHEALVEQGCACVRIMTQDDDMRHQHGKAHENARALVEDADALAVFLGILADPKASRGTKASVFSAISRLAIRNAFCEQMMENDASAFVIDALTNHNEHAKLVRHTLLFIKALAGNDDCRKQFGEAGLCAHIIQAMGALLKDAFVCEYALAALTAMTLRSPENAKRVIAAGGAPKIMHAMRMHAGEVGLQRAACMALRNMASRDRQGDVKAVLLDEHAEDAIRTAMAAHPRCGDVGKGALRDLGAEVEFTCLWKGENPNKMKL